MGNVGYAIYYNNRGIIFFQNAGDLLAFIIGKFFGGFFKPKFCFNRIRGAVPLQKCPRIIFGGIPKDVISTILRAEWCSNL